MKKNIINKKVIVNTMFYEGLKKKFEQHSL